MNCTECERASDNRFNNCPPRMDDGRHFTDYRPRCMSNFVMNNEQLSSFEYRQYLIKNTDSIMRRNSIAAYKANACGPCVDPYNVGTMLPEQSIQSCNTSTCKFTLNEQNGLGLGRSYGSTQESLEMKDAFLRNKENEQLYFKKNRNCCSTPTDEMDTFPFDGYKPEEFSRHTIPSGAPIYDFVR